MAKTELFSRHQPGGMFAVVNQAVTTGSIFFVNSVTGTNGAGYGQNPDAPVATIDYAVGLCTASKGDIIYVMEGHAEDIVAATSLVVDVAGVRIVGLGTGRLRPTLTFKTLATATISVTAANCSLENLVMVSAFTNGVTVGITVAATATSFRLINCVMEESLNTQEFLTGISVGAAAHYLVIDGLEFYGVAGGTDVSAIVLEGGSNFHRIVNCTIYGDFSGAAIDASAATASTYVTQSFNTIFNTDTTAALGIKNHATTTGMVCYNNFFLPKNDVGPTGAAMGFVENLVTNVAEKQGFNLPARDT